jgi:transposase-like protein
MARKNYTTEQIIVILRKMEVLLSQGSSIDAAAKACEITPVTYSRWRNKYGGMNTSDAKRLRELEQENLRLKQIVADQALDIKILKDVNSKNF